MKNAGRYQMQYRCFIAYPYCMPGIIASVKPGNNICFFSKKIYYFAFAFIAKLCPYYCYVFCHEKGKRKSVFKGFAVQNLWANRGWCEILAMLGLPSSSH